MLLDQDVFIYDIPTLDRIQDGFYKQGLNLHSAAYILATNGDEIPATKELIIENQVRRVYLKEYSPSTDSYVFKPLSLVRMNSAYFTKNTFLYKNKEYKVLCTSNVFLDNGTDLVEIFDGEKRQQVQLNELERKPKNIIDFVQLGIRAWIHRLFHSRNI